MGSPFRTAARSRARPRLDQGKQGGGAAYPLHNSAAGPPRPPHSPRPRPRATVALRAAVPDAATAAAPSAATTPDDDRAAILGALRQRRKAAPACGTATRSQRRPRSGIEPSQSARRKRALEMSEPRDWRRPLRQERRGGVGKARTEEAEVERDAGARLTILAAEPAQMETRVSSCAARLEGKRGHSQGHAGTQGQAARTLALPVHLGGSGGRSGGKSGMQLNATEFSPRCPVLSTATKWEQRWRSRGRNAAGAVQVSQTAISAGSLTRRGI